MTEPIKAVLVGAGQRGADAYAPYALMHPDQIEFVAVAEPNAKKRERFAARHDIPTEHQYETWEDLLGQPALGEAALICTQDWMHTRPALAALEAGYNVLLEKPMATTAEECVQLVQASEQTGLQLHICHVLRYTPHFQKMREIIQSGVLGDVVDVAQRENVGWWHMAHSFVRGNWGNQAKSSPMILAKCCHDLDILLWLLDDAWTQLSSIGNLMHYRPENAPEGAPERCLDGCPAAETCSYYAPWIYVDLIPVLRSVAATSEGFERTAIRWYDKAPGLVKALGPFMPSLQQLHDHRGWPRSVLVPEVAELEAKEVEPALLESLRTGPYGRCVYHCDNDVVDHQVVSMQFADGPSVTLTMHGHSHVEYRTTRIEGTRGRLLAEFGAGGSWIKVDEHRSDRQTMYDTSALLSSGHGGGDHALMAAFLESLRGTEGAARTTARQSLESHLMAFAAEISRTENKVVAQEEAHLLWGVGSDDKV